MSLYEEEMSQTKSDVSLYLSKVFMWMFGGLLVTGLIGYIVAFTPSLVNFFLGSQIVFFGLAVLTFVMVIAISNSARNHSPAVTTVLFIAYSIVNGLMFSVYFIAFDLGDIGLAFVLTGGIFAVMGIVGFVTKKDLTNFGSMLFISLIAIILVSIVNIFLGHALLDIGISIIIILVFMGLVVYDTKKLKDLYYQNEGNEIALNNIAIFGALQLYLDFLNIFIHVLRLISKLRD